MSRINLTRVILGGLLAGVILSIGEFVVNELFLGDQWAAAMEALNLAPPSGIAVALYVIWSLILGIAIVWIYAAIRPRFGPGPKTAVIAGLAVWFFVWFMGFGSTLINDMFPGSLVLIAVVWGLIETIAAALAGGWLYREEAAAPGTGV